MTPPGGYDGEPPATPGGPYYPPPGGQPYPGQAAPGYSAVGPPPAPRRRYWGCLWVAVGVIVLAGLGIGGCSLFLVNLARGPIDGANAWVALVDEGDFGGAFDNLCAQLRSANDRQEVAERLETSYGAGITGYSFTSVASTNGVTNVEGTIDVASNTRQVTLTMVEESGTWKVCTVPV